MNFRAARKLPGAKIKTTKINLTQNVHVSALVNGYHNWDDIMLWSMDYHNWDDIMLWSMVITTGTILCFGQWLSQLGRNYALVNGYHNWDDIMLWSMVIKTGPILCFGQWLSQLGRYYALANGYHNWADIMLWSMVITTGPIFAG